MHAVVEVHRLLTFGHRIVECSIGSSYAIDLNAFPPRTVAIELSILVLAL